MEEFIDFDPPEKGLNPGEEVVWSKRAGMAARIMFCGACTIIGFPWVILFAAVTVGPVITNAMGIFYALVFLFTLVSFVNSRRTWYYITNQRIVEARGGLLEKQIPLEGLRDSEMSEVYEATVAYTEVGTGEFYRIIITDPNSGLVMRLTGIDEESKEFIEKIWSQ